MLRTFSVIRNSKKRFEGQSPDDAGLERIRSNKHRSPPGSAGTAG